MLNQCQNSINSPVPCDGAPLLLHPFHSSSPLLSISCHLPSLCLPYHFLSSSSSSFNLPYTLKSPRRARRTVLVNTPSHSPGPWQKYSMQAASRSSQIIGKISQGCQGKRLQNVALCLSVSLSLCTFIFFWKGLMILQSNIIYPHIEAFKSWMLHKVGLFFCKREVKKTTLDACFCCPDSCSSHQNKKRAKSLKRLQWVSKICEQRGRSFISSSLTTELHHSQHLIRRETDSWPPCCYAVWSAISTFKMCDWRKS